MRILDRWESLVFTHFVTDGQRLPAHRVEAIEDAFVPRLRARGIVVGVHLEHERTDPGIRLVLECRPAREDLDALERELARILEPIPARPAVTVRTRVRPPERGPGRR
jgi:hypothetical protein